PPTYQKVNPADQPVLYLALSSPTLPLYTVDEYAQTNLAQRISTIAGVAQVQVFGSQKYAVRVQLDPRALTTRGIGIDEVQQALGRSNVNLPTGTLYGQHQMFNVMATGQLQNAEAFRPLIVAYRNGSPVRLEELGRVIDGVQTDKVASWYNDERAVILAIQRQPGTNSVEVVDSIRALLPRFRQELPRGRADRRQGDRVHHPVDDPLAGRGLHPGAVHGRGHGAAPPRVRGGHHRGRARVGFRLAHAHAHGLQPVPETAGPVARATL